MKIVDVCAFYTPHGGGVKTYIERKLKIGAAMGQEIVIIAPGDENRTECRPEGGRIIHIASPQLIVDRRYRYFDNTQAVHDVLDREEPDVIEASSPWRTASIVADWRGKASRALVMHADPLAAYAYRWFGGISSRDNIDLRFEFFWRYLRRLGNSFDCVVSANSNLSGRLTNGGVAGVRTIPMGVDPGIFSPDRRNPELRAELLRRCSLPEEALLLLGVGRMSAEKRWLMVIDASISAGHHRPVGLILVGDGRDRAKIASHIGGNPHIQLLAPIRERALLADVMASADALIHGCEAETFGLVAAEAVASGLPLIVPDQGGSSDLVTAATGETYESGEVIAVTRAIHNLATRNRDELNSSTRAAAISAPTIDDHFAELFRQYASLGETRRKVA
jgi:alpha-1,6-mannosyltransferase